MLLLKVYAHTCLVFLWMHSHTNQRNSYYFLVLLKKYLCETWRRLDHHPPCTFTVRFPRRCERTRRPRRRHWPWWSRRPSASGDTLVRRPWPDERWTARPTRSRPSSTSRAVASGVVAPREWWLADTAQDDNSPTGQRRTSTVVRYIFTRSRVKKYDDRVKTRRGRLIYSVHFRRRIDRKCVLILKRE